MPKKAAALKYNKATQATPTVVAKGSGEVAKKIIQKAKEYDVPLFANEALVNSLMDLELDHDIPPELYQAVVEVFVWIMKNEKKVSK